MARYYNPYTILTELDAAPAARGAASAPSDSWLWRVAAGSVLIATGAMVGVFLRKRRR